MAKNTVLSRYHRSRMGVLWHTINMGILAFFLGILYSQILNREPSVYIPHLVAGFCAWNLISSLITEGSNIFIARASALNEIAVPKSVFIYELVSRNLIVFFLQLPVYVVVAVIFQKSAGFGIFLSLIGILLICLNGIWVSLVLGTLCARYRDLGPLIGNFMRVSFFVTPVIWLPEMAGARSAFVYYNPFYYFIEAFRGGLLSNDPEWFVWLVLILITIAGWLVALLLYPYTMKKINFLVS